MYPTSRTIVTGPSLTSSTCIFAPKVNTTHDLLDPLGELGPLVRRKVGVPLEDLLVRLDCQPQRRLHDMADTDLALLGGEV
jgi:hypothetical protein